MFFFNDTATTEIYTLSLHDALPILTRPRAILTGPEHQQQPAQHGGHPSGDQQQEPPPRKGPGDRKSTRLNSSHANISYAVFCLNKKTDDQLVITLISQHTNTCNRDV